MGGLTEIDVASAKGTRWQGNQCFPSAKRFLKPVGVGGPRYLEVFWVVTHSA